MEDPPPLPFIFVPYGQEPPAEWLAAHPGAVRIPATFIPRRVRRTPGGQVWPKDRNGRDWPKDRFDRPICPLWDYPPGMRAPGEATPPDLPSMETGAAALTAAQAVFDDPVGWLAKYYGIVAPAQAGLPDSGSSAAGRGKISSDQLDIRVPTDRPVASGAGSDSAGSSIQYAQVGPANPTPIIPPDRLNHILARHGAFGQSLDPDAGRFLPQYSTPSALQDLANRVYQQATSADIGAAKHGLVAVAGALFTLNTSTGQAVPDIVGTAARNGAPTNVVVVFMDQNNSVVTMYPVGSIVTFQK